MFAYPLGVRKSLFQVSFRVTAAFAHLLHQVQKHVWKINYNLGGEEIYGEHNEPSFNFVRTPLYW